jgi:hypothetical protein
MSSSSFSNSSFSNSDDFISYSSDEDVLKDMDENDLVIFQLMAMVTSNSNDLFTSHEMEERARQCVDPTVRIQDVLDTMQSTQTLFKTLMNFTLEIINMNIKFKNLKRSRKLMEVNENLT